MALSRFSYRPFLWRRSSPGSTTFLSSASMPRSFSSITGFKMLINFFFENLTQ